MKPRAIGSEASNATGSREMPNGDVHRPDLVWPDDGQVAQQIGWVIGHHDRNAGVFVAPAAQGTERLVVVQQRMQGHLAQQDDDFRLQ